MKQPSLFSTDAYGNEVVPPAQQHSATSVEAAEAIKPRVNELQQLVLRFMAERGDDGATDEEGIEGTGLAPNTFRPRRIELVSAGMVKDSGKTRPTKSGRAATVWVATADARAHLHDLLG